MHSLFILSYGNTSNKIAQLVSEHRCETSWQTMLRVFPVEHNSSRDKKNCCKLKNFVAESRAVVYFLQQSSSTCCNFLCRETSCARQEKRAASLVNLSRNDPRRVELFCCSYYRSLRSLLQRKAQTYELSYIMYLHSFERAIIQSASEDSLILSHILSKC